MLLSSVCWTCDTVRKWHNERITDDTFTRVWEYSALYVNGFVAACIIILPALFFLAAESSNNEYSTVVRMPKATELEWIFSLNEEENEIVRSEFYYEQVRPGEIESNISSSLENYLNTHVCLFFLELSGS